MDIMASQQQSTTTTLLALRSLSRFVWRYFPARRHLTMTKVKQYQLQRKAPHLVELVRMHGDGWRSCFYFTYIFLEAPSAFNHIPREHQHQHLQIPNACSHSASRRITEPLYSSADMDACPRFAAEDCSSA